MLRYWIAVISAAVFASTAQSDTPPVSPFSRPSMEWQLSLLGGQPVAHPTTIVFDLEGKVAGQAPCNHFMGQASWTPERMEFNPMSMTMKACPDLDQERRVMAAFAAVTSGAIVADQLVLTMADGSQMVFDPTQ